MTEIVQRRLTPIEAQEKALECRSLSKQAMKPEHRVMLEHMAQTWERIAADMQKNGGPH